MRGFFYGLSFAFVAVVFLSSGIGHALRFARFRGDLRDHALVPRGLSTPIAAGITAVEAAFGAVFAGMLASPPAVSWRVAATAAAGLLAAAFMLYLWRLLRQPPRVLSCGCSFLSGQLTPLSVVPAASLGGVSLIGLTLTLWRGEAAFAQLAATPFGMLAVGWGATLAILVLVLPAAAAPRAELEAAT